MHFTQKMSSTTTGTTCITHNIQHFLFTQIIPQGKIPSLALQASYHYNGSEGSRMSSTIGKRRSHCVLGKGGKRKIHVRVRKTQSVVSYWMPKTQSVVSILMLLLIVLAIGILPFFIIFHEMCIYMFIPYKLISASQGLCILGHRCVSNPRAIVALTTNRLSNSTELLEWRDQLFEIGW